MAKQNASTEQNFSSYININKINTETLSSRRDLLDKVIVHGSENKIVFLFAGSSFAVFVIYEEHMMGSTNGEKHRKPMGEKRTESRRIWLDSWDKQHQLGLLSNENTPCQHYSCRIILGVVWLSGLGACEQKATGSNSDASRVTLPNGHFSMTLSP